LSIHPFFGVQDQEDVTFIITKPVNNGSIPDLTTIALEIEVESLEEAEDLFVAHMIEHATRAKAGWNAYGLACTSIDISRTSRRGTAKKLVANEADWPRVAATLQEDRDTRFALADPEHGVGRSTLRATAQNHNLALYSSEAIPAGLLMMLYQQGQIDGPAVYSNPDRFYLTYNPGQMIRPEDYVRIIEL
jgi:hypothetical protein